MPLLVVPLAIDETPMLTLAEYDLLLECKRVFFERVEHPLAARLERDGVPVGPFDDEPSASWDDAALVADPTSARVVELARAGAQVTAGASRTPDDLTAAHAAPGLRRAQAELGGAAAIMARLRSADGCPWDNDQTHESLKIHLIEECYEVIEAIEGSGSEHLAEELGDVLLQVAFHARLAEQAGQFDIAEVARTLVAKLVHRHPHVFGDLEVTGAGEVVANWEALKRSEKERTGMFDGIPSGLPALLAAQKVQKRAAGGGFETSGDRAASEVASALERGAVGDALFWLVALARARGLDPEGELRAATAAFTASFPSDTA